MSARDRNRSDPGARREQLARDTETFFAKGGQVKQADTGRRNPLNEDRHNSFLFLGWSR